MKLYRVYVLLNTGLFGKSKRLAKAHRACYRLYGTNENFNDSIADLPAYSFSVFEEREEIERELEELGLPAEIVFEAHTSPSPESV